MNGESVVVVVVDVVVVVVIVFVIEIDFENVVDLLLEMTFET